MTLRKFLNRAAMTAIYIIMLYLTFLGLYDQNTYAENLVTFFYWVVAVMFWAAGLHLCTVKDKPKLDAWNVYDILLLAAPSVMMIASGWWAGGAVITGLIMLGIGLHKPEGIEDDGAG